MSIVHQAVTGAGRYDAVSEQMRAWRRLLTEAGHGGADFAGQIDHGAQGHFEPLERLDPGPDDLIVIRYSAWSPALGRVLALPQRKLLVYHNITPPGYLWNHSPGLAVQCAVGRMQLPVFARAARVVTADSRFNAGELSGAAGDRVRVVPVLFDPARLAERGAPPEGEGPLVLVIGRLVPNKRHDRVFRAFAAYQRECAPDARLLCVGTPLNPGYAELLRSLAAESGARNITLAGGLSQDRVNAAYAAADVLLTLSEHEGFCVPLLEAFHFGVPVVAARAGAIPEVAGDAALYADGDPAVTAELLALAVDDGPLRSELARRGRERLAGLSYETTAAAVRGAVGEALVSEGYEPDNLLDRLSGEGPAMQLQYDHMFRREAELLRRRLPLTGGDVLSVGCGWNPGRHLFPQPAWRMTGTELDEVKPRALVENGTLEHGLAGRAGELDLPAESFDVVLYRLVLHHVVYQGPLAPVFAEAARLLRPGGALVCIEPGALHPVGAGLAIANALGAGVAVHGTADDVPLSPFRLMKEARAAGLESEMHAVTFTWRRMPAALQRSLWPVDRALGSRPRAAVAGHTLMMISRRTPTSCPPA